MQSGITKGWLFKLIKSEFESKEYVQAWIDKEIYHRDLPKEYRMSVCPKCKGRKIDWKTKTKCPECDGTGNQLPSCIGEILQEIIEI